MAKRRKRITAIRLSALGDIAMTVPAVKALAAEYPDVDVTFVIDARFTGLVGEAPDNLTVVGLERTRTRGIKAVPKIVKAIRSTRPDIVVDMHNVFKTTAATFILGLLGKKTAVLPKRRGQRKAILEHREVAEPFTRRYLDLFGSVGYPVTGGKPESHRIMSDGLRRVGIAPFARYFTKTYPASQTEELIRKLNDIPGMEIYLFGGGAEEIRQFTDWQKRFPAVRYISGNKTLSEEIELMGTLDVMVSMDSANMHLASLTGTRVVSLWGGTTPACGFLGWGQSPDDALVAGTDCQPCSIAGTKECPKGLDLVCMKSISPDEIINRII